MIDSSRYLLKSFRHEFATQVWDLYNLASKPCQKIAYTVNSHSQKLYDGGHPEQTEHYNPIYKFIREKAGQKGVESGQEGHPK